MDPAHVDKLKLALDLLDRLDFTSRIDMATCGEARELIEFLISQYEDTDFETLG